MTDAGPWTTCTVDGISVEIRTRSSLETERAEELMAESEIVSDVIDEVEPGDVFFDIGANVGLYALFTGSIGAEVVAIEPHPANLESLTTNLDRNDLDATVIRGALSDERGEGELYVAADEAGAGTHTFAPDQVSDTTISVPTFTGDGLVRERDVSCPTVAKLDVQGAEYRVLRGLENALAGESLRTIYCEVHPEQVERIGGSADAVESLLEEHGFEIRTMVDKEDVTWNIKATR